MATNHTSNYALNLWTPQDSFLREEFNENSQKIDAAIKAVSDGGLKYQFFVHEGTGTTHLVLNFDFKPMVVILIPFTRTTYGAGLLFRGQTDGIAVRSQSGNDRFSVGWSDNAVGISPGPVTGSYATAASVFNSGTYGVLALGIAE